MKHLEENNTRFTYLVADERDRQWGLCVNTVGFESVAPYMEYPHPGHPEGYAFDITKGRVISEYQLKYVLSGGGLLKTSTQSEIQLRAGDLFLIKPGQWHTYWPLKETGWDSFWIGFDGEVINNRVANGFFNCETPVVHVGFRDQVSSLFLQALDVAFDESRGHQQMLGGIAEMLCSEFHYFQQKMQDPSNERLLNDKDIVSEGRRLIRLNLEKEISIQEIADELKVSYSYFRKYFKLHTGYSPSYYQQFLRLQMAKEILQNTSASVAEVAYRFHFTSPDYFSFRFKEVLGVNPSNFKHRRR